MIIEMALEQKYIGGKILRMDKLMVINLKMVKIMPKVDCISED